MCEQPWVDLNPWPFSLKATTLTTAPRRPHMFGQIFRHFGDGRSSSTSLYPIGCKRHSCMFTCSMDDGDCKRHSDLCLAFKYARLYTTHRYRRCVLKVRSYGKGRAKKKWNNVPSFSKRNKKDSFVSVSVSKPSACISSYGSQVRLKRRRYDKKRLISKPFCLQALLPLHSLCGWSIFWVCPFKPTENPCSFFRIQYFVE